MKKGIIGKKIGMTQIFDANGNVIPVTVIEAGPCTVTMKKTVATDGYDAVQLGFVDVEEKKLNKPEAGHFRKAGVSCKRYVREFRLDNARNSVSMMFPDSIRAIPSPPIFSKQVKRSTLPESQRVTDTPVL